MKLLAALSLLLIASLARAQTVPPAKPVPFDAVELTWAAATDAAGAPLPDISYVVEVLGPGGTWGAVAIVRDTFYSMDGLAPGLWSFRVRALIGGVVGPPSALLTKDVVPPHLENEPVDPPG